jgi:hypothetical protein
MDIDEIRRINIRAIERDFDTATSMADTMGMTYAQYVNLRDGAKDSRSGKPRGMRKETAWRFEDAGKKPRGWLDQQHDLACIPAEPSIGIRLPPEDALAFGTAVETIAQGLVTMNRDERLQMVELFVALINSPDSLISQRELSKALSLPGSAQEAFKAFAQSGKKAA